MNDKQEPSQPQETISLESKKGERIGSATRTGNNAAWMCDCGYNMPLIWSVYLAQHTQQAVTVCKGCKKKYIGKAVGEKPSKIIKE